MWPTMATSTKLSKGVVILVAIAGQASLSISLSIFLAKARVRNQVGDKCRVSHQTQHLGLEVAAVFGRYHAAHDGDGGKDTEEGAAGQGQGKAEAIRQADARMYCNKENGEQVL